VSQGAASAGTLAFAAALLAGCSGGASQFVGDRANPSTNSVLAIASAAHGSVVNLQVGRARDKVGVGSVYVSDYGSNALYGYSQSGGSPTYTVTTGIAGPQGVATDKEGSVFLANTNDSQILRFKPPSTAPTLTINDTGEFPSDVAVDRAGNVWVSNICSAPSCAAGNIVQYDQTGAVLQTLTCANLARDYFIAVDKNGNVVVDGADSNGDVYFDLIPSGSTSCKALPIRLTFPGSLQFNQRGDLVVDDQANSAVKTYRAFRKLVHVTTFAGGIDPVAIALTYRETGIWAGYAGGMALFPYPAGGSPEVTISGLVEPIGIAVTPVPK
jgi:streptogramin lyase